MRKAMGIIFSMMICALLLSDAPAYAADIQTENGNPESASAVTIEVVDSSYVYGGLQTTVTVTFHDHTLYHDQIHLSYHIMGESNEEIAYNNPSYPLELDDNGSAAVSMSINCRGLLKAAGKDAAHIQFDLIDYQGAYWFSAVYSPSEFQAAAIRYSGALTAPSAVEIAAGEPTYTFSGFDMPLTVTFRDMSLYNDQVYLSYHILSEDGVWLVQYNPAVTLELDDSGTSQILVHVDCVEILDAAEQDVATIQFDLLDAQNGYWFSGLSTVIDFQGDTFLYDAKAAAQSLITIGETDPIDTQDTAFWEDIRTVGFCFGIALALLVIVIAIDCRKDPVRLLKTASFCAIGVVLFALLQNIVTPDWLDEDPTAKRTIQGIDTLEDNTVDVVFLGSSYVEMGISPMRLYEGTGIRSYNLAEEAQNTSCQYYLLKEIFKKQTPAVVVWEASDLFKTSGPDRGWRYVLDNMDLSDVKIEMAAEYERTVEQGDKWNAIFPIIKYHTRWTELTKADFNKKTVGQYYSAGQLISSRTLPISATRESIDAEVNALIAGEDGTIKTVMNGVIKEKAVETKPSIPVIPEESIQLFQKIKRLCEEHGAQLLLIKLPNRLPPRGYGTHGWSQYKYFMTQVAAKALEVPFFDLSYNEDFEFDFIQDTVDSLHHNIRGAEKVTDALGNYLLENYAFNQGSNEEYDAYLEKYQKIRQIAYLQSEMDFEAYLNRLGQNKEQWTILISAYSDYVNGLDEESCALLEKLGLKLVAEGKQSDAYMAVIERGNVGYEAVSDRRIAYNTTLGEVKISMSSTPNVVYYSNASTSIKVDGEEYTRNGRGLDFVIYDNESGLIIDSVVFDTYQTSKPATRNWSVIDTLLRDYESVVCFGEEKDA